jgi:hypothetical protein
MRGRYNPTTAEQNKRTLDRRARGLRDRLNTTLRAARELHRNAHEFYQAGAFHGGRMRELDDLATFLTDARDELTAFLKA